MDPEAGDGVRTHDPQLGKLMLYQLSYAREVSIVDGPGAVRGSPLDGDGRETAPDGANADGMPDM